MASEETYEKIAKKMQAVSNELLRESDRGCVILAFAWMDECLTNNLQRFLLPSTHLSLKSDELFGVGHSLNDAATKIDLSLRLGLLQLNTHKSLHIFRKLRNDFAHQSSLLTFETPSVKDRVLAIFDNEELVLNGMWVSMIEDLELRRITELDRGKSGAHILRDVLGTKHLFAITAGELVAGLMFIHDSLKPIIAPVRPV
jgi:hypothetical protein